MKVWCSSFREDFDKLGRLNNCSSMCDGDCVIEIPTKEDVDISERELTEEGSSLECTGF